MLLSFFMEWLVIITISIMICANVVSFTYNMYNDTNRVKKDFVERTIKFTLLHISFLIVIEHVYSYYRAVRFLSLLELSCYTFICLIVFFTGYYTIDLILFLLSVSSNFNLMQFFMGTVFLSMFNLTNIMFEVYETFNLNTNTKD